MLILIKANNAISENNEEHMFVTVWLGILELSTGSLVYASAGHERLALCRGGDWTLMEKEHLGAALGLYDPDEMSALPDKYRIVDRQIVLGHGDIIFQYTDGVTEATDSNEMLFGEDRLLEALNGAHGLNPDRLLPYIRERIDEFVDKAPQFDDITMLSLCIN